MSKETPGSMIDIEKGDLTTYSCDAIVNAANSSLMGGGGVDGAIHRVGGGVILEECKKIVAQSGRLPTGRAVLTTGGRLPARFVIHTVGPIWQGGKQGEPELLASCYRECLGLAISSGIETIAFPSISTGAYGYPVRQAAQVAISAVAQFLKEDSAKLSKITWVLFDDITYGVYKQVMESFGH